MSDKEEEAPFVFVKSRRRPYGAGPSTTGKGKSYSNSSGSITGPSKGFAYAAPTHSTTRGKGKKSTRGKGTGVGSYGGGDEGERSVQRAQEAVDVFVGYLGSALSSAIEDEEGGEEGRKSYAQRICGMLADVWPRSNSDSCARGAADTDAAVVQETSAIQGKDRKEDRGKKKGKGRAVRPRRIVCLGLGSPTGSRSAQVQLALLLVIRSYLTLSNHTQRETSPSSSSTTQPHEAAEASMQTQIECVAYDPVFTPQDVTLLERYSVSVPQPQHRRPSTDTTNPDDRSNADGSDEPHSPPGADAPIESYYTAIRTSTLLYMPHCDRELHEHLLSLNYPTNTSGEDPPVVLLSNVLRNYADFNRDLAATSPVLHALSEQFTTVDVPNWDSGKRSALVHGTQGDQASTADFARLWDKNALRDLAFHFL